LCPNPGSSHPLENASTQLRTSWDGCHSSGWRHWLEDRQSLHAWTCNGGGGRVARTPPENIPGSAAALCRKGPNQKDIEREKYFPKQSSARRRECSRHD